MKHLIVIALASLSISPATATVVRHPQTISKVRADTSAVLSGKIANMNPVTVDTVKVPHAKTHDLMLWNTMKFKTVPVNKPHSVR